jgi:hypothetical protein
MRKQMILALAALFAGLPGVAAADPGKDESGKGRRGGYARYDDAPRHGRYREAVRIPRGHLPPPGSCRDWYAGRPAGHQPPPYRC